MSNIFHIYHHDFDKHHKQVVFPTDFTMVATIELNTDLPFNQMTEDQISFAHSLCFEKTNSIDCAWWQNPTNNRWTLKPVFQDEGCRSTSVGDVIVNPDGSVTKVDSFGFSVIRSPLPSWIRSVPYPPQVLSTPAGWYIGSTDEDGFPYGRYTQYLKSQKKAESLLNSDWHTVARQSP